MGFFSSLFGGSNPTLNAGIKQSGQVSNYATGLGENLTSQAGNLVTSLLSGDPTKSTQILAPQISATQQRAQQAKNALAQFSPRSGGTASTAAGIDTGTRGDIGNMIASLTGQALGTAGSMGTSLIDTGMKALNDQVNYSQMQMQNWQSSILGKGITMATVGS